MLKSYLVLELVYGSFYKFGPQEKNSKNSMGNVLLIIIKGKMGLWHRSDVLKMGLCTIFTIKSLADSILEYEFTYNS